MCIRKNSLISLHLLSEVSIESKENSICMKGIISTLLIAEILSGKNARAWVSMDFT